MDKPLVAAEHSAGEIDDIARLTRFGTELSDNTRIVAARHEADVLAIWLSGDDEPMPPRMLADRALLHAAEREAQEGELFARRREQEITLVAFGIERPVQLGAVAPGATPPIMHRRQRSVTECLPPPRQLAEHPQQARRP